jgi:hypothetical protein
MEQLGRGAMAIRKKGRSRIAVNGRRFVWWVHREREVRIASEDKQFVVSYHWVGDPKVAVSGPEFPGIEPTEKRPVWLAAPAFTYQSPAGLARQVIDWAFSADRELKRLADG